MVEVDNVKLVEIDSELSLNAGMILDDNWP